MSDQERVDILNSLYSIVNDLWGSVPGAKPFTAPPLGKQAAGTEPAVPDKAAAVPAQPEQSLPAPASETKPAEPSYPPIAEYWRTSDEPLPWTEALIQPMPRDGLTSEKVWRFCHEWAGRVLDGDTEAYGKVLETVQPLADLSPYTALLRVKIQSADTLQVTYGMKTELSDSDALKNLCCTAIRIARDLFAALPVTEIDLQGQTGVQQLQLALKREEIRSVRWGFADAEDLVKLWGGHIK